MIEGILIVSAYLWSTLTFSNNFWNMIDGDFVFGMHTYEAFSNDTKMHWC